MFAIRAILVTDGLVLLVPGCFSGSVDILGVWVMVFSCDQVCLVLDFSLLGSMVSQLLTSIDPYSRMFLDLVVDRSCALLSPSHFLRAVFLHGILAGSPFVLTFLLYSRCSWGHSRVRYP